MSLEAGEEISFSMSLGENKKKQRTENVRAILTNRRLVVEGPKRYVDAPWTEIGRCGIGSGEGTGGFWGGVHRYFLVSADLVLPGSSSITVETPSRQEADALKAAIDSHRDKFGARSLAPSGSSSAADLLMHLDSLRAAGVLTEEEFQAKRVDVLRRM